MLTIKLVRHGESEQNIGKVTTYDVGDHAVALSERGHEQARDAGRRIGREFLDGGLIYVSPYKRTRETVQELLVGAAEGGPPLEGQVRVYEDPRLREVEHGYEDPKTQDELRRRHGWFYYRFRGGESPADCYDRVSSFLESMMRQAERKTTDRIVIVTHGLMIRCFIMRFLHLSVEDFDSLANPANGAIVTLGDRTTMSGCLFTSGAWGVAGLSLREAGTGSAD
ncbi:MAG: phosphoglycerate mutase family domain containing protein [Labilithrix sp.]|nr:phosphoglycerate mutase family domain containing protein [Labilithrix sp.]